MALSYLDIETDSIDPSKGTLRTIQTRLLDRPGHPLIIRHVDDFGGERKMLEAFQEETRFYTNKWGLTPCGFGLSFEHKWLAHKARAAGLVPFNWDPLWLVDRPQLDLHHFAVLCRGGAFDGTKLSDYSAKALDGRDAAAMAYDRNSLERYIADEADAFCDFYWALVQHCGPLMEQTIRPELTRLHQQRRRQRGVDEQEMESNR